ncbi:DUF4402 domain-containing protein [Altererythrobacter sp. MF3-039]|uniref:DUF4402 domain-containing protein n=1 Tax=Altererythrobacter sp. MF3-039 TaxID=3252901 RepID=UPI00390C4729
MLAWNFTSEGCLRRIAAALALAGAVATPIAPAAAADNTDASGRAVVTLPSTLVNLESLDFGPIVTQGTGGAVTIDPNTNGISSVGDVTIVGTTAHRATFRAQAPIGTVMVMSGDPSVILTRNGGTETMTANLVYDSGTGLIDTLVFGLPIGLQATASDQFFHVGGTLIVSGTQAPGDYEGTFTLSLAYL